MAEQQSSINPWVRANLQQPDEYTRSLIPEQLRENYDYVISELGSSAVALSDAQDRYSLALTQRANFFKGLAYE